MSSCFLWFMDVPAFSHRGKSLSTILHPVISHASGGAFCFRGSLGFGDCGSLRRLVRGPDSPKRAACKQEFVESNDSRRLEHKQCAGRSRNAMQQGNLETQSKDRDGPKDDLESAKDGENK